MAKPRLRLSDPLCSDPGKKVAKANTESICSNSPRQETELEDQFDAQLGDVEFVWEERTSVQTLAFSVGSRKIWVSIDRNVIRTEMLRIIDSCLPIVKRYS